MQTVRRRGPEIDIAQRLEYVRGHSNCTTLRDFWRELTLDGAYQVSYEAVRNYHHDREPPVEYLVQVARVFDVDLEWLATGVGVNRNGNGQEENGHVAENGEAADIGNGVANGNGLASHGRERARDESDLARWEFEKGIREHLRRYDRLTPLATAVLLRTCDRFYRDAHLRAHATGKAGPTRPYVGRFVGKAIAGPLVNAVAGTVRTCDLHPWQLESYVLGMCSALTALIPNPNWVSPQATEGVN